MRDLISELKSQNINLSVDKDELVIDFDSNNLPHDLISKIKDNKRLLIEYLEKYNNKLDYVEIPLIPVNKCYQISSGQLRLWMMNQLEELSSAYNMPNSLVFDKNIDFENFKLAINSTIERHEILRTVFKADETGEIKQWVLKTGDLGFKIAYKDFRKEQNKREKVEAYIREDAHKPFNLEKGPLLRASLLQVEDENYVFYYNMHHIISDGWSMEVLSKDVFSYYEAYKENRQPSLKALRIQYKNYSAWQLTQLKEESFKTHRAYWLNRLGGEVPLLDLPVSKQRPRIKTSNGRGLRTYIDSSTTRKLKKYSKERGGSLFMSLLAAWNILMYRYTGQKDIIIGTPIAGREHVDLEDQIGFYVNTLALRNEIKPEESFNVFYSALKDNTLKGYSHQMYPFDTLVKELNLARDTSRSAVFDVMLTLQNNREQLEELDPIAIELNRIVDLGYRASKFDVDIAVQEMGDYLSLHIVYNPDVYEQHMMEGLIRHYKQLLNALLESPEEKISQIEYLSQEEKQELLFTFNDTQIVFPNKKTIVDLFEEQVSKTPNNIAVVFEGKGLTYQELHERSNQLAHYLQKKYKIEPDDLIGVKLERSEWMIISVLGILKSGGAYVPIDPEYPQERIDYIEKDTRYKVCIDENEVKKFKKDQKKYSQERVVSLVRAGNLAYVIYTSGSTGIPKGVMIEHANLVSFMSNVGSKFRLDGVQKMAGSTNLTFDISSLEIFGSLCTGKELILLSKDELNDPHKFLKKIEKSEVEGLQLTPSRLSQIYSVTSSLPKGISLVLVGGEALSELLYETLKKESFQSINVYGPTETTIWSTFLNISDSQRLSIGIPLLNEHVYILSDEQLQPIGVTGEICIGGAGLARGYLNQEVLTAEKFIANPFKEEERLYKTGDLGRWLPDGNIEFIGRKDNQVKIRGYRIELGEIEHALQTHEEISEAVVLIKENQNNEKELVAYITSKNEQNTTNLRSYLKAILPEYMLPVYYVQLESLPLTSNGKVDKKSLPDPQSSGLTSGVEYISPRNEMEKKLVKIWAKVLQRENIGVKDDFFALGGHSLKAVRLSNEYQKGLSVSISLKDLFLHTSIESQAKLIRSSKRSEFIQIEKVTPQASYPISDAQRRLWVLSQFEGGAGAYNIPGSIYLNQDINIDYFKRAIYSTIERHEILRTVFKADEKEEIRQWIVETTDLGFEIDYIDFREEQNKHDSVESYIREDSYKAFDLEKGPLLRASILQVEDKEYIFYYNMHHIISDGWSMEVLSKDVFSYYKAHKENKEPELEELRIQYKDYSAWQLAQLKEELFKTHRAYWLKNLSGELPLFDLPSNKQRPRISTNNGHSLMTYIDSEISGNLKKYSEAKGGSLFMSLLAVWNVLMYRYTEQKDIIIGTPIAGREHADLEEQIGFYVNTLALRNEIKPEESFNVFYSALKDNTLTSYSHQMYPFDRLVEELNLIRDTSRSAVFDIMLDLQNNGEKLERFDTNAFDLKKEEVNRIVDQGYTSSKFDMEISFQEVGEYLSLQVVYNTDVYEREMVEGLINHYKQLLHAVLDNPEEKISQMDYLSKEEKHELLVVFNDTKVDYPKDKTIIDIFEAQVEKKPNHIALVFEEKELTFKQLHEQSNQLAHYLKQNYTIQPDDLVGIKQDRSEWMVICMLGVLKAGGAYVPIDPEYPLDRINYIEKDAKCKVCIDENELKTFKENQAAYSKEKITSCIKADNLAYVIYTSGTTGQPKGAMITNFNVINIYHGWVEKYDLDRIEINLLQMASMSFDMFVADICRSILAGGKAVLCPSDIKLDPKELYNFMLKHTISIVEGPPAILLPLMDYVADQDKTIDFLKILIFGADNLDSMSYRALQKNFTGIKVINSYGTTEATIDSSFYQEKMERDTVNNITPIGKPFPNTSFLILDSKRQLLPVGIVGELYIGGVGLAKGYLNKAELTKEKFVPHPFKEGERLYKTGDLGRWTTDGNIEFMGRKDDQVKIRGYRIELGEIEQALLKNAEIEKAVVIVKENQNKEKELVAYITSKEEQNSNSLRSYLKEFLPDFMLPLYYVQLEALPLTANGKVDKRSLPDPQNLGLSSGIEYIAPETTEEKVLVSVWEDVLKREGIGIKDNFYNLGGDSIKSIQVVSRLKQRGYALKVVHVLRTPIIEELSLLMKQGIQVIDQSDVKGFVEMTPIQKWFFEDPLMKLYHHSNQSVLLKSKEEVDKELLEQSIADLTKHHDALRMVFQQNDGIWKQVNQDTASKSYTINFYDLRNAVNANEQLSQLGEQLQSSIDLTSGPLFRVAHFRLTDGDRVGLIIHHLVVDGVSWRILLEDLSNLYTGYKAGKTTKLPLKTDSFQRWAFLQKEYATSNELQKERAYWEEICSQKIKYLREEEEEDHLSIDSEMAFTLDKQTTELLQTRVHSMHSTEINDVLLTGLGLAIKEVFSIEKSVLNMEGHGREEIIDGVDISRTVGWFTSIYPFVLDVSKSLIETEVLVEVKESLRRIPTKGIGFGILKYLSKEGLKNELKPEIVFNYLGDFGKNAANDKESIFEYASESLGLTVAKENVNAAILDIYGMLVKGELFMSIGYSKKRYNSERIEKLVNSYEKNLKLLIGELSKNRAIKESDKLI